MTAEQLDAEFTSAHVGAPGCLVRQRAELVLELILFYQTHKGQE